jgi:small subunit ribosomal protein S8
MSMTDPIADMLARIRNAISAGHRSVEVPGSTMKRGLANILKQEGFIEDVAARDDEGRSTLVISLRWVGNSPAIEGIQRLSRPGQRRYARVTELPKVRNGLGVVIVSTPKGLMTDRSARKNGVGGELVCSVW